MRWPIPKSAKDVQQFHGLAGYYRRFVRDFTTVAKPLHRLTENTTRFELMRKLMRVTQDWESCPNSMKLKTNMWLHTPAEPSARPSEEIVSLVMNCLLWWPSFNIFVSLGETVYSRVATDTHTGQVHVLLFIVPVLQAAVVCWVSHVLWYKLTQCAHVLSCQMRCRRTRTNGIPPSVEWVSRAVECLGIPYISSTGSFEHKVKGGKCCGRMDTCVIGHANWPHIVFPTFQIVFHTCWQVV